MTTSDKIALASFIIAFISFVLTIVTIYITRGHNMLSVKPIPKIIPYDADGYIAVFIKNAGTGPLIRHKLKCSNGTLTASCLIDLMPNHATIKWANFSKFEDFVIPANENETLIEIKGDPKNNDFNEYKKNVRQALKDITIICDYTDIYGQKFVPEILKLEYCYSRPLDK